MNPALFKGTKPACDLPEHRLRRGDIVKLVDTTSPQGGTGQQGGIPPDDDSKKKKK